MGAVIAVITHGLEKNGIVVVLEVHKDVLTVLSTVISMLTYEARWSVSGRIWNPKNRMIITQKMLTSVTITPTVIKGIDLDVTGPKKVERTGIKSIIRSIATKITRVDMRTLRNRRSKGNCFVGLSNAFSDVELNESEEDEEAIIERRRLERQKLLESLRCTNSTPSPDLGSSPKEPEMLEAFSEEKLMKSVTRPISKSESALFAGAFIPLCSE